MEEKRINRVTIITAIIGVIATVLGSYFGYLSAEQKAIKAQTVAIQTAQAQQFALMNEKQALMQQQIALMAQQTALAVQLTALPMNVKLTPYATYTPQVIPVEIAILNISSQMQADGTLKQIADLSISPLGLGSFQLTSPATMKLGESSVIKLTITPDTALTGLPKVTVSTVSANDPGYVLEFSDRLQIYPIMIAELKGVNFEITSDGNPEKPVTSSLPVEWIWSVTPKLGGKQALILVVSVPVIIDKNRGIVSAQTLKNIPIEIQVEVTATPISSQTPAPTLTPTLVPAITRIKEQLIDNSTAIIVACISLIGVLAGTYVAYLNMKKTKVKMPTVKGKTPRK